MDLAGHFKDTAQLAAVEIVPLRKCGVASSSGRLQYRQAAQDDMFRMARMFSEGFPHTARAWGTALYSKLQSELSRPDAGVLGAFADGKLCGFAITYYALGARDTACLAYIASDGLMRGQGIGEALLHAAEDDARKKGHSMLILQVRESNIKAQRLYRKSGYVPVAIYPQGYSDGETAHELGKWVGYSSAGVYRKLSR